jgi:hypothetical protein
MQSSHFATNFPVVGIAALPPSPQALGGDIFVIGSPKHYRFDKALRTETEDVVPVSILRLRPFYYVFNRTIARNDKIYKKDDPRLQTGVKGNKHGTPERKRWWEATTIWTGVDFGAGPGGVAVREVGEKVVVMGVGGGISLKDLSLISRQERRSGIMFARFGEDGYHGGFRSSPLNPMACQFLAFEINDV